MKQLLLVFTFVFSHVSIAQVPEDIVVPRLVVGITIDQMRADMIARYWNGFGKDGFKRLVRKGSWVLDTRYRYVPTFTGPGACFDLYRSNPIGPWHYSQWLVRENNKAIQLLRTRHDHGAVGGRGWFRW